ncbi:murein biosynthesis integral membrane protein MurJ [Haloimpatiens massiliensis]|uniref:murein biosynthesis integral membrane protein MurJ n=1 Tax=Haloimpatiens massiliensis TaxID=1658110 RepID=UPI000C82FEC0|nr:murein biosynthesis integral membrane protein MurJ [Haloimpatiens massiliensis]
MSRKSLAKSTVIIMVITLLSKVMGFFRESLVAAKYGTSFSSDIYVFAWGVTSMLFATIGVALSTTFIPMLSDYIENKSFKDRNYFVNNILNITVLLAVILSLLGVVFGKYVVLIFGPGFATKYSEANFLEAIKITRIVFISLIFVGVQNVLTGVLQAHKEFAVPASMSIFFNIVLITYLILWGDKFGAEGLIIALVIAFFAQMLIHIPTYIKLGYKYRFVLDFKDRAIKKMMSLIVPVIVGTSITQVNFLVDRAFASSVGEGSISTLNFANKLNLFIYGVFGMAISTVVYTELSRESAKEDIKAYERTLTKAINTINLVMIPATVGMVLLRVPIIDVVFKHGAFDDKAAKLTASVLVCYAPAMIIYGIRDVMNRAFYSIKDTKTPMINSGIGVLVNIVLNIILIRNWGINGLAIATTVAAVVTTILLLRSFIKQTNFNYYEIVMIFCKVVVASLIMGVVVFLVNMCLNKILNKGLIFTILNLGVSSFIGVIVYAIIINKFNVEEYKYLARHVYIRLKKKNRN